MRASAESDVPRQRIQQHAHMLGQPAFARVCAGILDGADADPAMLSVLAGRAATWFVAHERDDLDYWQRVWAGRGLLWAWHDSALPTSSATTPLRTAVTGPTVFRNGPASDLESML